VTPTSWLLGRSEVGLTQGHGGLAALEGLAAASLPMT